jgi:hypothetical protein
MIIDINFIIKSAEGIQIVVILVTRWCAVGISRNPFKIRGALSWVTFPTSRIISLGNVLDGVGEQEYT